MSFVIGVIVGVVACKLNDKYDYVSQVRNYISSRLSK